MSIVDKLSAPHGGKQSVIRMLSAILCVGTVLLVGALLIGCPSSSSSSSSDDGSDTTRIAAGQTCTTDGTDCVAGHECTGTPLVCTALPPIAAGQTCTTDGAACVDGHECTGTPLVCTALPPIAAGLTCTTDGAACVGGHECNETTQLCTAIGEGSNDCAATAQTTCTATVGTAYTGQLTDGDSDWITIALTALTTYRVELATGSQTIVIRDAATPSDDLVIGADKLYTPPTGAGSGHIVVVSGTVGDYSLRVVAEAEGNNACNSMDAEADCDSDGVNNGADEFDRDAGLICTVVESGTGANPDADCDNDGTPNNADALASNGCASADGDGDGHPDTLATVGTPRSCTTDMFTALQVDNCPTVNSANLADADSDDAGDVCDVDDDNNGLIEIRSLEDLNNIRYDLDGHSYDDEDDDAAAGTAGDTAGAPAANSANVVCDEATDGTTTGNVWLCGYELARDLDFATAGSYAAGEVNLDWRPTTGTGAARVLAATPDAADADSVGWLPIDGSGTSTNCTTAGNTCFDAILDGNGNGIANLFINRGSQPLVGLIGRIAAAGAVRNLTLTAVSITGEQNTGGLAGLNSGTISASDASGAVTGTGNNVGGLVGMNSGTISASSSASTLMGDGFVGGLVGTNIGTIRASYASGTVMSMGSSVGGLVGNISESSAASTISDSYATGDVTGTGNNVGGLVGSITLLFSGTSTISASYATGDVTGTGNNVGGLVGNIVVNPGTSTISGSYASGDVMGTGDAVGGLVGLNGAIGTSTGTSTGIISGSYASGSVTGTGATGNGIGGLVGRNQATGAATSTISGSYASGAVTGTDNFIGGLIGRNDENLNLATSYWIDEESGSTPPRRVFGIGTNDDGTSGTAHDNVQDTGETDTIDAQGLTIAQMRANSDTFPDFSSVVQIVPTITNPPTVNFSAVWDYTADCFPRLKQWVDTDGDGVIDANEPIGELLPGQGTPAGGTGACAP